MTKFKVGDSVERVRGHCANMWQGDRGIIQSIDYSDGSCTLNAYNGWHLLDNLCLVEPEETLPELTSALHFSRPDGTQQLRISATHYNQVCIRSGIKGLHLQLHYLDPDDALDLASDIRRIAMAAKRKQAQKSDDTL